jgi:hypothetical protein
MESGTISVIDKESKKQLGKFYTEEYNYIFQDFLLPPHDSTHFMEPFVGKGHLLRFLENYYNLPLASLHIDYFDLEQHMEGTDIRDSIQTPPHYENTFILTNPPYLALNKTNEKETFRMYGVNDLYKCFLKTVIHGNPSGGLFILPINFWSSIRKSDILLRKMFLERFQIVRMNLFEQRVFHDTTFTVTSFLFQKRNEHNDNYIIPTYIFPSKTYKEFEISEFTHWMIGGELYHLPQNEGIVISRVYQRENKDEIVGNPNTRIFLHALDDGVEKRIHLEFLEHGKDLYIGKDTDRTYASLQIHPPLSEIEQRGIVKRFNQYLEKKREEYHSMFLTNYRESRDFARKRISFQFVYQILNYLISHPNQE